MNKTIETIVWSAVVQSISFHSTLKPSPQTIKGETSIKELFPTRNEADEQANRFGFVMFHLFDYFNKKFNLSLKMDYSPREEFSLFQNVGSVYSYFYIRITSQ